MKVCPKCQWMTESDEKFCPQCGSKLKVEKRNTGRPVKWMLISAVLFAACIGLAIYSIWLRNDMKYLRNWNEELREQKWSYQKQAEFMDEYIAIIDANSDEKVYHTYDCSILGLDSGEWTIKAYNTVQAENLGYEPCPECH